MNNKKELPNVNLQKTSVIFMQLGLILAMFIVYVILEHESFYKPIAIATIESSKDPDDNLIKDFVIEKKKQDNSSSNKKIEAKQVVKKQKVSADFKTTSDEKKEDLSAVLELADDEKPTKKLTADDFQEVDEGDDPDEIFPFLHIEYAPEYPGCKGSLQEKKLCFNNNINKFVQRKFNSGLAQELGLSSGKKKIAVQFVINKEGNIVDVKVRGPHRRLEKEAKRIVNLLPKMKPARQGKKFANVRFNLPIVFNVED